MASVHGNEVNLRLVGDIRPQQLRSHDLGEVIAAYEAAIAAIVAQQHVTVPSERVTVSLVDVYDGSVGLAFDVTPPEFAYPAALTLTKAISQQAWESLPLSTLKPLRKILCFLQDKNLVAQFDTAFGSQSVSAQLTPDLVIPPTSTIYEPTELVVEVIGIGGAEPTATIRTLRGDTLHCDTTEEVAKQLGQHLYQEVRVSGAAEWDFESLSIVAFEIAAVEPFERVSPVETFAALREEFGEYFDDIDDPEQWLNQNRQG